MHQCAFCQDPVKPFDQPRKSHLVLAKGVDDHIHVHGDLHKTEEMRDLLEAGQTELGIDLRRAVLDRKEVVFHNRQRIGDILMFTCGVRDFKAAFPDVRVNVVSTASHIWDHNPAVDRSLQPTEQNTLKIGPGFLTNASNRLDWHFANAYRISIENALKVSIQQGESRPDIWLTEEEWNAPRLWKEPYWVIVVGGEKGWGCKMYPFDRWQEVVRMNPDIRFVQLGAAGDNPPRLQGPNVVDYVGRTEDRNTGIRDLFKIFLNAEGSLGLVSFHMHLSAALYKPSVVVAGAREPVSFTRYQGHAYLANDGMLPCAATTACWHCGPEACTNRVGDSRLQETGLIPKCVDMIPPEEVTRALRGYYVGGRLRMGVPSEKPKPFKRIVPTPLQVAVPAPVSELPPPPVGVCGLVFNKTTINPLDWMVLQQTVRDYQITNVLEFGAGLSTLLLSGIPGVQVTSYETHMKWAEDVRTRALQLHEERRPLVRLWDGQTADGLEAQYDLAFVDGPCGGDKREAAVRIAAERARVVIVHDTTRKEERVWQEKYLLGPGTFEGPINPPNKDHRCGVFVRKTLKPSAPHPSAPSDSAPAPQGCVAEVAPVPNDSGCAVGHPTRKSIKIVSTARGWGGAQRSITTLMKLLLEQGHQVEFIPFHHTVGSREFRECLQNGLSAVRVSDSFDTLRERCDTLLVYADDFVWEFPKPEVAEAFSGLQAERKLMMVNYRRGQVGQLPWTQGWDRYLFLNAGQERDLLEVLPGVSTQVLPPCTDLRPFFEVEVDYTGPLRVVRHNSQGDTKFARDAEDRARVDAEIAAVLAARPDAVIRMMPGPSWIAPYDRFIKHPKNAPSVPEFLALGNVFWYSLPEGYLDMGPRVIMEAMAAGLAVVADPWGGAVDRVTSECGWLTDKPSQVGVLKHVSTGELRQFGQAARQRAREVFHPERWVEALVGT